MNEKVFFEEFDSLYYYHGSSYNWSMERFHFHKQYEIILFLNDGAVLEIESRIYNVQAGDLFLINGKEYHRTNGAPGKPHNRYVLMFEPQLLEEMSEAFGYDFAMYFENRDDTFMHKLHLSEEKLQMTEKLFSHIEHAISEDRKDVSSAVKIKLAILRLMLEINNMYTFLAKPDKKPEQAVMESGYQMREITFKSPVLQRDRIDEIKKYVQQHVEEKLELEDIANEMYMNKFYLSHYFKKETGFTLLQYITNQKIIAAKSMLKQGRSVTEIAMQLSYNSDSHFISVFKKNTGMTPKKYGKDVLKLHENDSNNV